MRATPLALSLGLLFAPEARAAEVVLEGFYQARGRLFDTLSLDRTITQNEGVSWAFEHRLNLAPRIWITEQVGVMVDVRALDGLRWGTGLVGDAGFEAIEQPLLLDLAGDDLRTLSTGSGNLELWRAWGEVRSKIGTFKFGRQPLHWGLGIWQNDGQGFNTDAGDSADRVSWEHRIQNVWVRAAADVNVEGLVGEGDDTTSFSLAAAYRTERMEGGLQAMLRHRGGEQRFDLSTLDGTFDLAFGPIGVAGEVVAQLGRGDLSSGINDVSVTAVGAVLDAGAALPKLHAGVEAGLATGDGSPNDAKIRTFTFDRDHNVGFLLFEQPMPTLAATNAEDDDGRDFSQVLTGQSVSNALYLKPRVAYELTRGLWADASFLAAKTAKATDAQKALGRTAYGYEVDVGLRWQGTEHLTVTGTFGTFIPGKFQKNYTDEAFTGFKAPAFGGQLVGRIDF